VICDAVMIFMAFERGDENRLNTFVLLHSPRKHQKDPKVQFLSPKVQFSLLTIWKFQVFFVTLQKQWRCFCECGLRLSKARASSALRSPCTTLAHVKEIQQIPEKQPPLPRFRHP